MMLVIPIFIPFQGCPQHCLFCNQVSISGKEVEQEDEGALVHETITEWLNFSKKHQEVQVAFYGGSFTCLPEKRQQGLLDAVQAFLQSGRVDSIRLSTRPDCMDGDVCDFLLAHGVKTVELGVQSLDDDVLNAAGRGHGSDDSLHAMRLLKDKGILLGVQLMPGLPRENTLSFLETIRRVIECRPDFVRLYPTLVIRGSGLAGEYEKGRYKPISMNRAVALCCLAKERFDKAGVQIIRMGLQASRTLEEQLLAGPYHPAFGEFVTARHWLKRVRSLFASCSAEQKITIRISNRDVSALVGPKRLNKRRLQALGLDCRLKIITDTTVERGTMNYVID